MNAFKTKYAFLFSIYGKHFMHFMNNKRFGRFRIFIGQEKRNAKKLPADLTSQCSLHETKLILCSHEHSVPRSTFQWNTKLVKCEYATNVAFFSTRILLGSDKLCCWSTILYQNSETSIVPKFLWLYIFSINLCLSAKQAKQGHCKIILRSWNLNQKKNYKLKLSCMPLGNDCWIICLGRQISFQRGNWKDER